MLRDEARDAHAAVTAAEGDRDLARDEANAMQDRLSAVNRLGDYHNWADVDHEKAARRAAEAEAERKRLAVGSSRLAEIQRQLDAISAQDAQAGAAFKDLVSRSARVEDERRKAEAAKADDDQVVATHPDVEQVRAAYPGLEAAVGQRPASSSGWGQVGERLTDDLTHRIDRSHRELGGLSQRLLSCMNDVLGRWPELRTDLDLATEARGDYVKLHRQVTKDDLPRFEEEFKRQLNTNTVRELAQFNAWLRRQADQIDDRVARINDALGAIDYSPGHYVRLEKQGTNNSDVIAFRADLRRAVDHTLTDDDHYSEQRFLDVKRIIERFRGREGHADADRAWTRRVTDVRNWFVFSVSERLQETQEEWEHYSDSDGKSGGQKEKLAYTILAASLAYQFGLEWGVAKSRDFRFAVIDEAFSRGSDVATRYALELFAKLGLQLLIITPLQKVQIIEPYVRAIGFVDNPGGANSRLYTMTIEEYRSRRGRRMS